MHTHMYIHISSEDAGVEAGGMWGVPNDSPDANNSGIANT